MRICSTSARLLTKKDREMEFKKLLWFEIRFGSKDRKNGWIIRRKENKRKFIMQYKSECEKAFNHGTGHKSYKTTDGFHLVGLARKELKYEDTTYAGDIYYSLWMMYKEINEKLNRK